MSCANYAARSFIASRYFYLAHILGQTKRRSVKGVRRYRHLAGESRMHFRSYLTTCFMLAAATQCASPAWAALYDGSAYKLNVVYTNETWDNASGGIKQGVVGMNNIDAALFIDADKAFGFTGGSFEFETFYEDAHSLDIQYVGSVDTQSSIDTTGPQMLRLYQAFYDQNLGSTDVRVGIYDLETEFSNTKPALLFLSKNFSWNTAYDLSGTMTENGTVGPGNYPYTPLAIRVEQKFDDNWSAKVAIADGGGDSNNHPAINAVDFNARLGVLGLAELDYQPSSHTKLMAGVWGLTSQLPVFNRASLTNPTPWSGATRAIMSAVRSPLSARTRPPRSGRIFHPRPCRSGGHRSQPVFQYRIHLYRFVARQAFGQIGLAFAENHAPQGYLLIWKSGASTRFTIMKQAWS